MDGLRRVVQDTDRFLGEQQYSQDQYNENLTFIRNTAVNVMEMVNYRGNLAYPSHLQTDPVNLQTDNTAPRREPRSRERRGRRTNAGEGTSTNQIRASNYVEGSSSHHGEGPHNFGEGPSQPQFYNPSPNYAEDSSSFTQLLGLQTPPPNLMGFGNFATGSQAYEQPRHSFSGFEQFTSQPFVQPRSSFSAFHPFPMNQNEGQRVFLNSPPIPLHFDYQTSQNMMYPPSGQNEESQDATPQQVMEQSPEQQRPQRNRPQRQRFQRGCGTDGHLGPHRQ